MPRIIFCIDVEDGAVMSKSIAEVSCICIKHSSLCAEANTMLGYHYVLTIIATRTHTLGPQNGFVAGMICHIR